MNKLVGVKFKNSNRICYFLLNDIDVKKEDKVIVDTERGLQLGIVTTRKIDITDEKIENDLRRIFKKYDCIFFEQLSELMSDIISTWEEYDGM